MKGFVPPDPEGGVSKIQYAVVYVPKRNRNRFAANCVEIKTSAAEALAASDNSNKQFAAKILGPSNGCVLGDDQIDNFDNGYSEPDVYDNYYNDCNEYYIFENAYLAEGFLYCLVSNLLLEVEHKILLS